MNPTGSHGDSVADTTLGATITLQEFLTTTSELTLEERRLIVDQALVLIEQLYVHLPLKRAMHAIDPVQRLKLLRYRLRTLSQPRFHDEMISIFMELRDLHTNYFLPAPFASTTALLPLHVQEFFEDGERRYLVTFVFPGRIDDPHFEPGVVITHWNGIPMDRAVELNADRQAGSNLDARHAQGLDAMTARWMGQSAAPDEEWIVLTYVATDGQKRETRLEWLVFDELDPSPTAVDPNAAENPVSRALGIDLRTESIWRARKMLFRPEAMKLERQVTETFEARGGLEPGEANPDPAMANVSTFPDKLRFESKSTSHGEFGYVSISSFDVGRQGLEEVDAFVAEVARIVRLLPQNGLIVDVRGNGGGTIMAGERLLQLFTPKKIEPERLHFINTPLTLELSKRGFEEWRESIEQAVEMGTPFSDGFYIFPDEEENCNRLGQQYDGPVVLITNALCYSTTDIFAAGFQDNKCGRILGTDGNTGAGGANVIDHEWLSNPLLRLSPPIQPLPKGTGMRVAIRRTSRVGERSGDPLEDLGVVPEEMHRITKNDLLNDDQDLIEHAASILARLPVRKLAVEVTPLRDPTRARVSAATENISRLDAYLDGRPMETLDVENRDVEFDLSIPLPGSHVLELRGFDDGQLVAAKRIEVQ
jgi:hypothetical protein